VVTASIGQLPSTVYLDSGYALDAATGVERWSFRPAGLRGFAPPAAAGELAYFSGYDGLFYAVDAASGVERWRFPTGCAPAPDAEGAAPPAGTSPA
jgi:outer membrane protein assembly factor BamB